MDFRDFPRWFAGDGRGPGRRHGGPGRGGFGRGFGGGGGDDRGFRGGWSEMFRERPQRAERGGVRYLVLDALTDASRHGYEIMQVISDRTRGAYKPSPGVIYPTLQMLEELGHVRVSDRDDKKVYAITAAGTRDLEAHRDEVASFYEQSEDVFDDHIDELRDFMHRVKGLMRGFRRAARRGRLTPTTMAKVRVILEEAATKLEAIIGTGMDDDR